LLGNNGEFTTCIGYVDILWKTSWVYQDSMN